MIDLKEYEEKIRPALARLTWGQYSESSQKMFDPLRNGGATWALQVAISQRHFNIQYHELLDSDLHMREGKIKYTAVCNLHHHGTPKQHFIGEGDTPTGALIMAVWELVKEQKP